MLDPIRAAASGELSWREAFAAVRHSFRASQSRNVVYLPPDMPVKIVFKLSPDARKEAGLMAAVKKYVPGVRVPNVLHVEDGLLVTEFIEGEPLLDLFHRGDLRALPGTINLVAQLHAGLPQLWARTNLRERLELKLRCPHLNLTSGLVDDLMDAMAPVIVILDNEAPCSYLDRVPCNFLVSRELVAIDWEGAEWAPPVLDLANLLSFTNRTTSTWREGVDAYVEARPLPKTAAFWAAFCAAVIFRALCFASAWSRPRQQHLRIERINAVNRAVLAVSYLMPTLSRLKPVQDALTQVKAHLESESVCVGTPNICPTSKWLSQPKLSLSE
jgi:hypothetical protein